MAIIVYCVNWAVYCYEIGYYHFGFNVPISLIEEPKIASLSTSVIGGILLIVVWVIVTLIGRWAYRNRVYLPFIILELMIIGIAIVCPIIPSLVAMNVVEAITTIVIFLVWSAVLTLLLNAFSLSCLVFPSIEDKLVRKKAEIIELEKRINDVASQKKRQKFEKKRNDLENQINELEQQAEDKEKVASKDVLKDALVMVEITVFSLLIVGIPSCLFTGINEVMQEDELTLVMNAKGIDDQFREILSEDYVINGLAIIYENEDGLLVSPCHISNREVVVYTNFQQFIESEGLIVYTNTYGNIIPKTAALSFDSSNDNNVGEGNS